MDLFLDTNIYLNFYKLSADDLEELKKLTVTVKSGGTTLYVTDQVRDEFMRNREKTIADSLKLLEDVRLPKGFPRLFTSYPGYAELRETLKTFEEQRSRLLQGVTEAAAKKKLQADVLIDDLFRLAQSVPMTPAIWQEAQKRVRLGNPPGKDQSMGDALNWESLLAVVPSGHRLLLVTADDDFMSKLDPTILSDFLRAEWAEKKRSKITVYANLTALFKQHYPNIKLAAELEKELAINRLIGSEDFMQTHGAILALSQYADFSGAQAQALIEAANRNTQIRWILGDEDVHGFFTWVAETYEDEIDSEELEEFWRAVAWQADEDESS